nr:hypothetical protein CR513_44268 [Ipomoea trifida]
MASLSRSNGVGLPDRDVNPGRVPGNYLRLDRAGSTGGPPELCFRRRREREGLDQNVGVKYEVKLALQYSGAASTESEPRGVAASFAMSSTRTKSESRNGNDAPMVARSSDAFAAADATKWNTVFCGHDECCRMESTAAIDPRM